MPSHFFAGGFGTQDECFEALTLVQTGKSQTIPIVMVDAPGRTYWQRWREYVEAELLHQGLISPDDTSLYHICSDPKEAVEHIQRFYRNYHSQRFVHDTFVIRMRRPLHRSQVEKLNDLFAAKLVKSGRIEQGERPQAGDGGHRPAEADLPQPQARLRHAAKTHRPGERDGRGESRGNRGRAGRINGMSTLQAPPPPVPPVPKAPPASPTRPHEATAPPPQSATQGIDPARFTTAQYYAMSEAGVLDDRRTELIDGVIYEKMPPDPPHASTVDRVAALMYQRFGGRAQVRVQNPSHLRDGTDPEPDIMLLKAA